MPNYTVVITQSVQKYLKKIRAGNYRIIYEIEDKILKVTVIEAGDRKEIY